MEVPRTLVSLAVLTVLAAGPAWGAAQDKTRPGEAPPAGADGSQTKSDGQAPPAPRPDASGLDRLSADWPKWLKVGVLYRGRIESVRPVAASPGTDDGYYLNRLRLSATVVATPWLQVVTQIQDAEALGYGASPVPKAMAGGFDLRQGYVEIGRKGPTGVVLTAGRQEFMLGEGRLVGSPDWGNSSRTYDMGRVSGALPGVKVDVFRAAPLDVDPARFDRAKPGEHLWGAYATLDRFRRVAVVDIYALQKATSVATGEGGSRGDGRVYTYGTRVVAGAGKTVSGNIEAALQRGHLAADSVSAWALHAGIAWSLAKHPAKPTVALAYDFASGDADPRDGTRGTFDQLYASNHARHGVADLVGWRNVHAIEAKADVTPVKKLKVSGSLNRLLLATAADSWYGASGTKWVLNTKATSRDIGWEPDVYASYAVSKEMTLGAGLAVLLPGAYVRESTTLDRYWYPYATWTLKF